MNYDEFLNFYSIDYLSNIDTNIHDYMLNRFIEKFKDKQKMVFFDIGCNAGSFIKSVNKKCLNVDIHAFEPHPYLYKYLSETYTDCFINQMCVTNEDGFCKINIPSISVGISSIVNRQVFQQLDDQHINIVESKSIKIDTYLEQNKIKIVDFIKLDVEGAEYFVFEGAKKSLESKKILCGQFEIGIDESGYSSNDIFSLLNEYGYEVDQVFPNDCFFYLKKF